MFDAFRNEGRDGYDTQQWIGAQPWCNGKIGTLGGSYVGITQWLPAPLRSDYLVCMMPVVATSDMYDFTYPGGAFRLRLWTMWGFSVSAPHDRELVNALDLNAINRTLPLLAQDRHAGWRAAFVRDWISHPTKDVYWQDASIRRDYEAIQAHVYNVGGWYDFFLEDTLTDFASMRSDAIAPGVRHGQKLLVGPWGHDAGHPPPGDIDFGDSARVSLREQELRWVDSRLKGIDTGIMAEPPVRIFVMGANEWRYEADWPLKRAIDTPYYLHSGGTANSLHGDGALGPVSPSEEPADAFTYDPLDPVPSLADTANFNPFSIGPFDQRRLEERKDVLVYTTDTLTEPVEVTGPIEVVLYAASSAPNTDWTAKLLDVHPDGKAIFLCEGILRASYRNGSVDVSNIVPGRTYRYGIDLTATSNVFMAGHRIRLEVSSSNFPRFDRNLNTGLPAARDTTWAVATQTVYHNAARPSHILLPIVPPEAQ